MKLPKTLIVKTKGIVIVHYKYTRYMDNIWQHLFSIEDDGKRSERAGLLGHKQFIPAYEFPDDKAAMVWFMLGYEK